MTHDLLVAMFARVAGLERDGNVFVAKAGHQITLYMGELGQGMTLSDVERLELREHHVEITAKGRGTLYCPSGTPFAIADNVDVATRSKRAGFGLV